MGNYINNFWINDDKSKCDVEEELKIKCSNCSNMVNNDYSQTLCDICIENTLNDILSDIDEEMAYEICGE